MDRLTRMVFNALNRLRRTTGIPGNLRLDKVSPTGYGKIEAITDGWYAELTGNQETNETTPEIRYDLQVVESALWSTSSMDQVAAVVINGRRYSVKDRFPPIGTPLVWVLKIAPTGETVDG